MNSIDLIYPDDVRMTPTVHNTTAFQARSTWNQLIWRIIAPQQDNARCHIIKTAQEQAKDPDKGTVGHRLSKKCSRQKSHGAKWDNHEYSIWSMDRGLWISSLLCLKRSEQWVNRNKNFLRSTWNLSFCTKFIMRFLLCVYHSDVATTFPF